MAKLTKYLMVASGVDLLFYFAGLLPSSAPSSLILNFLLNPDNIITSSIYTKVASVTAGAAAIVAVVVGVLTKDLRLALAGPFGAFMTLVVLDFMIVIDAVIALNNVLAIIIFMPVFLVLFVTIVEWILGQDT